MIEDWFRTSNDQVLYLSSEIGAAKEGDEDIPVPEEAGNDEVSLSPEPEPEAGDGEEGEPDSEEEEAEEREDAEQVSPEELLAIGKKCLAAGDASGAVENFQEACAIL